MFAAFYEKSVKTGESAGPVPFKTPSQNLEFFGESGARMRGATNAVSLNWFFSLGVIDALTAADRNGGYQLT